MVSGGKRGNAAYRLLSVLLSLCLLCGAAPMVQAQPAEADWTVAVYMCASDLESEAGCATDDLIEMIEAEIPDNVNVLVMTGGTSKWNPEGLKYPGYIEPSAKTTQLYWITDQGMQLALDYGKYLDMGDEDTLAQLLVDVNAAAPAKHMMVVLWNHGGGPTGILIPA